MDGQDVATGSLFFLWYPDAVGTFFGYGLIIQPEHKDQLVSLLLKADRIMDEICYVCHKPFTAQEWDDRHTTDGIYDCHSYCCPECNSAHRGAVGSS